MVEDWPRNKAAPALDLADLEGRPWSLAQARGKIVLLNFWATWCEPCRNEMPALAQLARDQADDLVVVAVNYQETAARVQRFLESVDVPRPILLDPHGAAARAWTRRIFPTTVVVDPRGRPARVVVGEYDWLAADARALLDAVRRRRA